MPSFEAWNRAEPTSRRAGLVHAKGPDARASSPSHWHNGAIAGWMRADLDSSDGAPTWPLMAVPVSALTLALPWAPRWRHQVEWSVIPVLPAISLLVAPYARMADAMLALPVQVAVAIAVDSGQRIRAVLGLALVAVEVASVLVRSLPPLGRPA